MMRHGVFDLVAKVCLVAAFLLLLPIAALTIAQMAFGYHSYALLTQEMSPAIPQGSLVVSHPTNADLLQPGDIVAFHPPHEPDTLVTRRVVRIEPGPDTADGPVNLLATRAASASKDDPWLIPSNVVVDREVLSVPIVGYPAAALQTRFGRFFFLVLPAALLCLVFFSDRRRVERRLVRAVAAAGGHA